MHKGVKVMWKSIKLSGLSLRLMKSSKELLLRFLCAIPSEIEAAINEWKLCVKDAETVVVGVNLPNQVGELVSGLSKLLNNKWLVHMWCAGGAQLYY
jgi:hypothetical protein